MKNDCSNCIIEREHMPLPNKPNQQMSEDDCTIDDILETAAAGVSTLEQVAHLTGEISQPIVIRQDYSGFLYENYHLYEFQVNGQVIGLPDPTFQHMEDREVLNARRETIKKHVQEENSSFTYVYDFGDDWQHTVTLIKIDSTTADPAPLCLDGARSCPQEDTGGAWGHQHLLEVLLTPNHPEREHFIDWVREGFDPEHFSCEEMNHELQKQKDKLIPKSLINRPAGR